MRAFLWSAAVLAVGLVVVVPLRADDESRKVIDKAIKAHGGAETLKKLKDRSVVQKGKMHITTMGLEIDATLESSASGGEKKRFRQDMQFSVMGQDIRQVVAYDGKQMWISVNDKIALTVDKKEDLDLLKESLFAEEAAGLVLLDDKSIETSIIGEDKVGDTPVIGVRVSKKGFKDVSLYFDKETGLLRKIHNRGLDFQTKAEVEQERILDDYKDFDGQKRPTKAVVIQDGKKLVEIEFTETKYVDSLGDDVFAKPKE